MDIFTGDADHNLYVEFMRDECGSQGDLMRAARYAEVNPVAAGVVEEPGDYEWSSAPFHLGLRRDDLLVGQEDRKLPYLGRGMLRGWPKKTGSQRRSAR